MIAKNPSVTKSLGAKFGSKLKPGNSIALFGELGSGKTTFIQGIALGLQISNFITSPSFTIVNEYPLANNRSFYHVDLYRTNSISDIEDLGILELFRDDSIVAVEWAEKMEAILPDNCMKIYFKYVDESEREINYKDFCISE